MADSKGNQAEFLDAQALGFENRVGEDRSGYWFVETADGVKGEGLVVEPITGEGYQATAEEAEKRFSGNRPGQSKSRVGEKGSLGVATAPIRGRVFQAEQTLMEHLPWRLLSKTQMGFVSLLVAAIVVMSFKAPMSTAIVINALVVGVLAAANLLKLMLIRSAHETPCDIKVSELEIMDLEPSDLPMFTILVPLYKEAKMVAQVVKGIELLDYPKDKLDVKMLVETDDWETRGEIDSMELPAYFETLVVPEGGIKGKPRACNLGLMRAKGEYLVIYDAEDRPERDQLLKVVAAFRKTSKDVVCLQAKLNYFNRKQNLLTRWFTAEYSAWFDQLLPGLQAMDVAIPLGGTSNHFNVARLKELGGWNPYNVTEDADLGIRIYIRGWKTAILDTTTFEEANSRLGNWIRQRSRWVKGYMQTYIYQMRHPIRLYRTMGGKAFVVFQLFVGVGALCLLLNPVYLGITIAWFGFHLLGIKLLFPGVIYFFGLGGFFFGNAAFILTTMAGCIGRKNFEDVKWSILAPFYWLLMSVASYKALYQLVFRPFYWEKTEHGFSPYVSGEVELVGVASRS